MTNNTDNFNAYLIKIIHNNIYQHIAQRQQLKFLNFTQRKSVVQVSLSNCSKPLSSIHSVRAAWTYRTSQIYISVSNKHLVKLSKLVFM